jgi:murein DD-endopeptidase MepM/ murein hydrolase activator NlpD
MKLIKPKYKLNTETLVFERVRIPFRQIFRQAFVFFLVISVFGFGGRYLADPYFDSLKLKSLKEENQELRSRLSMFNDELKLLEASFAELQNRDRVVYRSALDIEPLPASIRQAGFGGSESQLSSMKSIGNQLVANTFLKIEQLSMQSRVQSKSLSDIYTIAVDKQKLLSHKPSIQPLSPADYFYLSSTFGYRWDPFTKGRRLHQGLDFAGEEGLNIYSTGDGVVVLAERDKYGYGNQVLVNHGFGYMSRYAHLKTIKVLPGQKVKRGHILGELGNTGRSTGPHLHYEVIRYGKPVNPFYYFFENLTAGEYDLIISQAK